MKQLPETFRKNELPYTLIKRNDVVALYGVSGTYTEKILHYEVCQIHHQRGRVFRGVVWEAGESLPSDERFGRDGSRAIKNLDEALTYFDELTEKLKLVHRPQKSYVVNDKTSERYQAITL
jgi:hypothetical protein